VFNSTGQSSDHQASLSRHPDFLPANLLTEPT